MVFAYFQLRYILSSLHFNQTDLTVKKTTGVAFFDILLNLSTFDPLAGIFQRLRSSLFFRTVLQSNAFL